MSAVLYGAPPMDPEDSARRMRELGEYMRRADPAGDADIVRKTVENLRARQKELQRLLANRTQWERELATIDALLKAHAEQEAADRARAPREQEQP